MLRQSAATIRQTHEEKHQTEQFYQYNVQGSLCNPFDLFKVNL